MSPGGKKYKNAIFQIEKHKKYSLKEAIENIKKTSFADFDESVDMAVKLGIDPRRSDQNVRGSVVLPRGSGKKVRVIVFAKGEKEKEAHEAGADYVGLDDLISKIEKGWLDFDRAVATNDAMSAVSKLGRILGPRGLMPNPKTGTVTFNIARAVKEIKAGKVEFKTDKGGIVHIPLGKMSFNINDLLENTRAFLETLVKLKPESSKGQYLRGMAISSTMGPGIAIDHAQVARELV